MMDEKKFEELKESVIEAGKIMRGELKPSREFVLEVDRSEIGPPIETWAVCVETDDEELLIPGKLYFVKIKADVVWVRDEAGDATLCPADFFLPVSLSQEVTRKLTNLAQAA